MTEGSPADTAGVLVGDILLRFDGRAIQSAEDLLDLLVGDRCRSRGARDAPPWRFAAGNRAHRRRPPGILTGRSPGESYTDKARHKPAGQPSAKATAARRAVAKAGAERGHGAPASDGDWGSSRAKPLVGNECA